LYITSNLYISEYYQKTPGYGSSQTICDKPNPGVLINPPKRRNQNVSVPVHFRQKTYLERSRDKSNENLFIPKSSRHFGNLLRIVPNFPDW